MGEAASVNDAVERLGRTPVPEIVVVGSRVPNPAAAAQVLHRAAPDVSLFILAAPGSEDRVRRALQFAPFIGDDVRWDAELPDPDLARQVIDGAIRTRQRRSHRAVVAAAAQSLKTSRVPQSFAAQYLGHLLEVAPIGVLLLDSEGRIVGTNPRAVGMFGRSERELTGAPLVDYFCTEHREPLREWLTRAMNGSPTARLPTQFERLPTPSRVQHVELLGVPVPGRDGEPGVMAVLQDVTARVLQDQARNEFLAAVAHDLRTPLAGIKAHAQILRRRAHRAGGDVDERLLASLQQIDTTVNRMSGMLNGLLDLARLRLGQPLDLDLESVDLVALAQLVVANYRAVTERLAISVTSTRPQLVGQWDRSRLERVLENLVGNAVKYSPGVGEVTVNIAQSELDGRSWAVLEVRDQGLGIPADDLPRIFERFRRGSNVVGQIEGTGVGLVSAKQIVELHGGHISAESIEGSGSTFRVQLPLSTSTQQ